MKQEKTSVGGRPTGVGFYETIRREMRLRNYSQKTVKAYTSALRSFVRHFRPRHPRTLDAGDIREYLLHLIEQRQLAIGTVDQAYSALRFLFVDLYKLPFVMEDIPRPIKGKQLPPILSQEEVMRILAVVKNLKHRTSLILIYSAGLRVGEAVRLKVADIDGARHLIHLRGAKGRKDRYTLLSELALEQLRLYYRQYRPREYLFEGAEGRNHLSERSIQHVFERAVVAAGIRKNVSVHTLRHSFATHLHEGGTDIHSIQKLLGHSRSTTTEIYTHVSQKTLGKIISPLDQFFLSQNTPQRHMSSLLAQHTEKRHTPILSGKQKGRNSSTE